MQNYNVETGPGKNFYFFSFFFENIQKPNFFLVKLIWQWILDGDGQGIARDVKKKYFHFQKFDKKW